MRLTLQPVDAPKGAPGTLLRALEHIGSDRMMLFSTDYPHWHFDGDDVLPDGLSDAAIRRVLIDNPLETYPRLQDGTDLRHGSASASPRLRGESSAEGPTP